MSRTYRKKRPKMKLGYLAETHQYSDGSVRDGTPQHATVSCNNHGGCHWCEGNRLHKNKRNEPITDMSLLPRKHNALVKQAGDFPALIERIVI